MLIGRFLILFGLTLAVVGALMLFLPKIPWLGRLPGDILIKRDNFSFSFPIVTCLILSAVLTLLMNLFFRR